MHVFKLISQVTYPKVEHSPLPLRRSHNIRKLMPSTVTFWSLELMVQLSHWSSSLSVIFCGPCFILLYTEWLRLTCPVKEKPLLPSGNKRMCRSSCPKPESQTPVSFSWVASQTLLKHYGNDSPHSGSAQGTLVLGPLSFFASLLLPFRCTNYSSLVF